MYLGNGNSPASCQKTAAHIRQKQDLQPVYFEKQKNQARALIRICAGSVSTENPDGEENTEKRIHHRSTEEELGFSNRRCPSLIIKRSPLILCVSVVNPLLCVFAACAIGWDKLFSAFPHECRLRN